MDGIQCLFLHYSTVHPAILLLGILLLLFLFLFFVFLFFIFFAPPGSHFQLSHLFQALMLLQTSFVSQWPLITLFLISLFVQFIDGFLKCCLFFLRVQRSRFVVILGFILFLKPEIWARQVLYVVLYYIFIIIVV